MPFVSAVIIRKTNFQRRSKEANCTPRCEIFNFKSSQLGRFFLKKKKKRGEAEEARPLAGAGFSLVMLGQGGHICKMKGEAALGCFHRGMERSGSGPQHKHQAHCSSSR